jgi:hypothetical protein
MDAMKEKNERKTLNFVNLYHQEKVSQHLHFFNIREQWMMWFVMFDCYVSGIYKLCCTNATHG